MCCTNTSKHNWYFVDQGWISTKIHLKVERFYSDYTSKKIENI
jgi:hypothetical protein